MKIGLTGSSMDNKTNLSGSATPIVGFMNELLKNKHQVVWLEKNPTTLAKRFSPVPVFNINEDNLKSVAKKLDLDLIIIQTWTFDPTLIAKAFKSFGTKIYYWDDNTPLALMTTLETAPYVDLILSHGKGASKKLRENGIPLGKIEIFYFATDPVRFRPQKSSVHSSDVVFVGTNLKERNDNLEKLFFEPSLTLRNCKFNLHGSGWNKYAQLRKYPVNYKGWAKNEDLNKIFSNSTVSINATRHAFRKILMVPSNRIFDIMASGTVLLTDPIPGIERMFKVDEELLIAKTADEAKKNILEVLKNKSRAESIKKSARKAILQNHCWSHRVKQLGLNQE